LSEAKKMVFVIEVWKRMNALPLWGLLVLFWGLLLPRLAKEGATKKEPRQSIFRALVICKLSININFIKQKCYGT
jgi:hypothetical protein